MKFTVLKKYLIVVTFLGNIVFALSDVKNEVIGEVNFRPYQESVLPIVHVHSYNGAGGGPIVFADVKKKDLKVFGDIFEEANISDGDLSVSVQYIAPSNERLAIKPQYYFCSLASEEARCQGALKGTRYNIESTVVVQYLLFRDDGFLISSVIEPPTPVSIHNFTASDSTPVLSGNVLHLRSTNPSISFNEWIFSEEDAKRSYALVYNINFSDFITCYIGSDADFAKNPITISNRKKNHSGIVYLISYQKNVSGLNDKIISEITNKAPLLKSIIQP